MESYSIYEKKEIALDFRYVKPSDIYLSTASEVRLLERSLVQSASME
jgi:hypothetical protein